MSERMDSETTGDQAMPYVIAEYDDLKLFSDGSISNDHHLDPPGTEGSDPTFALIADAVRGLTERICELEEKKRAR